MKLRIAFSLFALVCACATYAAETNEMLFLRGDLTVNLKTGVASYTNGFLLKYGEAILTAERARLNRDTGDAYAEGNVILQREGGNLWRGEQLHYNFKTRVISGQTFRAGHPPYFVSGTNLLALQTNSTYALTNSYLTTDDVAEPFFRIAAKEIVVSPGKSISARHAVVYLGDVPVMYFPYYRKSMDRHPNNYDFVTGYRSEWGAYLLNTYNWYWSKQLDGAVNLDLRSERGVAGGPDFRWKDPTFGEGILRYYYAYDLDPEETFGYKTPDENRQRVLFAHQANITSNLTARAFVSYHSDPFVVRDFFESEYQANAQPRSFVEVDQSYRNWNLNGMAQFRVNDFQETIERLPDVKLTGLRQQIGATPLYYESESSAGYFRHLFPAETNYYSPGITNPYAATRADTFHQVVLPLNFFGWLNVVPRVGQRFSYYSEADGRGATTAEAGRSVFNTGAEVSWKAARVYRGAESELLDVKGLRHIIEPSFNYVFVPSPSKDPSELPQFDRELPTSRMRPIDFPDYNTIDSIDSQSVLRMGLRNRLQTKREDGMDDLLAWAVYCDWRLAEANGRSTFGDVYSDLDFRPRSWLTFNSGIRIDVEHAQFQEVNHTVTLEPADRWSLSLGHRYQIDSPDFGEGYDIVFATLYLRINENWGVRTQHHFDVRDGLMEHQDYTIYRDFRSWTGSLTFRVREDRNGPDDYTVAVAFSLKAFPRFKMGEDSVRPHRLVGG